MLPRAPKVLSAYRMRTSVLDKLSSSVDKRQSDCLERHSNWTLSIDGWTDSSHNNLLAVLLEDKETQHYLGNLELGDEKHTADNIHRALVSLLGEKIKLIKGFVTDNPNVMLKLRSQFCTEFPHIYNLKCVLHVLNLVSKDVIWSTEAKIIAGQINKLAVFFSNTHWRVILLNWGKANNMGNFLSLHVETRWYSFIKMTHAVIQYKEGFRYCLGKYRENKSAHTEMKNSIIDIIESDTFFDQAKFLNNVLTPIGDAIAFLENRNTDLGDVWNILRKLFMFAKTLNSDNIAQKQCKIGKIFERSLSERAVIFNCEIYLTAFFLTPSFRQIAVSGSFPLNKAKRYILSQIKIQFPNSKKSEAECMIRDIEKYHDGLYPFDSNEKKAEIFWSNIPNNLLANFAKLIFSLLPSSASLERLFSKLSRTKTPLRNAMTPDVMVKIGRLKLDIINSKSPCIQKEGTTEEFQVEGLAYEQYLEVENEDREEEKTEEQLKNKKRVDIDLLFDSSLNPLNLEIGNLELEKEDEEMDWVVEDILDDSF